MEERLAIVSILVEQGDQVEKVNALLHDAAGLIKGRMGLPKIYREASVIVLAVVGPQPDISAMSGKLGVLDGVSCQVLYSKK